MKPTDEKAGENLHKILPEEEIEELFKKYGILYEPEPEVEEKPVAVQRVDSSGQIVTGKPKDSDDDSDEDSDEDDESDHSDDQGARL